MSSVELTQPRTSHFELVQAELVGGIPEAFFQGVSRRVLLRWRDQLHVIQSFSSLETLRARVFQMVSKTTEKGIAATSYQQLKLAMDVQAASMVVVRMMDGANP